MLLVTYIRILAHGVVHRVSVSFFLEVSSWVWRRASQGGSVVNVNVQVHPYRSVCLTAVRRTTSPLASAGQPDYHIRQLLNVRISTYCT